MIFLVQLYYSGIYLRWLSAEHIYITSEGRLQVGGLTGAVLASSKNTVFTPHAGASGAVELDTSDEYNIALLTEKLTEQKEKHRRDSKEQSKTHKKKYAKKKYLMDEEDEEDENNGNNHTNRVEEKLKNLARKLDLPRSCLYNIAPEVLLGGAATAESSVFTAGALCGQILTGKQLIKVSVGN